MKNLPKEKRDRLLITAGATLVAVVALYYVLISRQQSAAMAMITTTKIASATFTCPT